MNLPVSGGRCFLQRRHHHIDKAGIPIGGFPKDGIEYDRNPKDHYVLDPYEEQHRAKEPDHRIHDGQTQELGRPHEAEEEGGALSHLQRPQRR